MNQGLTRVEVDELHVRARQIDEMWQRVRQYTSYTFTKEDSANAGRFELRAVFRSARLIRVESCTPDEAALETMARLGAPDLDMRRFVAEHFQEGGEVRCPFCEGTGLTVHSTTSHMFRRASWGLRTCEACDNQKADAVRLRVCKQGLGNGVELRRSAAYLDDKPSFLPRPPGFLDRNLVAAAVHLRELPDEWAARRYQQSKGQLTTPVPLWGIEGFPVPAWMGDPAKAPPMRLLAPPIHDYFIVDDVLPPVRKPRMVPFKKLPSRLFALPVRKPKPAPPPKPLPPPVAPEGARTALTLVLGREGLAAANAPVGRDARAEEARQANADLAAWYSRPIAPDDRVDALKAGILKLDRHIDAVVRGSRAPTVDFGKLEMDIVHDRLRARGLVEERSRQHSVAEELAQGDRRWKREAYAALRRHARRSEDDQSFVRLVGPTALEGTPFDYPEHFSPAALLAAHVGQLKAPEIQRNRPLLPSNPGTSEPWSTPDPNAAEEATPGEEDS